MLQSYLFWLLVVSTACWGLERCFPWRRGQSWFRAELGQDFFFLFFNGHAFGVLLAWVLLQLGVLGGNWLDIGWVNNLANRRVLSQYPLMIQFVLFLIGKDFLEWCVHNLLHRVSWLWEVHKIHHSIITMDWLGNFRFHFLEVIVYRTLLWLPILPLGPDPRILLPLAVFVTAYGHLNHANIRWDYGPFRFILNSPRVHLWHHDEVCHFSAGQNFAIVFSLWDTLFGTLYLPVDREDPERLGFRGIERFPEGLPARFWYPFVHWMTK